MNQVKYVDNAYSNTGTFLIDTTLESILMHCLKLPQTGIKGKYGSIFVYESKQLAIYDDDLLSTGIILADIDYIPKQVADVIYDNFELLSEYFPSLLAIQYSSSYYINPNKNGLHIFIKSQRLNKEEYSQQAQICLAVIAQFVYKLLNIDLLSYDTKDKSVLDFHNTNLTQRFNLFYSTFKYNENAEEFNLDMISLEDLEKLTIKYNLNYDTKITKTITPFTNNVNIGDNIKKIKIDRNIHIGKYSGNDIRYRISIIADILFKDNAKDFCDKYFYYGKNQSIYTHYSSAKIINPLIYKWLVSNKYIIENSQNIINNWIDEYSDMIIREIIKNRQLEIISPTGTGKTTFINNFLAYRFNSVVIVPFNVTNRLYDNLFEVNADYCGNIPNNKPIVMIWDQAIKHWESIKDRHFIIDEAHTLFFDRTYRDAAIKLILKLKENNNWVTFITATPAGEKKLFNMKQIHFYKKREIINMDIKTTSNIEWSQYNYIKKCIDENWYDKIVLLDDTSAKKIYEQFIINCYGDNISYIRSSTKESKDFIDLRDSELLKKKLTICTCVAFNGLNFKNQNENILVIGSIQQGVTTSGQIIQQIGRIRNSKVKGVYFYNPSKIIEEDIDGKEQKAIEFNNLVVHGVPDTFLSYERKYLENDYTNAKREIQEYQRKHSNINDIVYELSTCGYIKGKVEEDLKTNDTKNMSLAIKRKESDELKDDIINNRFYDNEYDTEYKSKWAKDINYIISNPFYSGIDLNTFIDMFSKGNKHKLIETYISNVKEIIRYTQVDNEEYIRTINNINLYASMISGSVDRIKFLNNIKKIKGIREKYVNMIQFKDNKIFFDDVFKDVISMEEENQLKEVEAGKKGGKKSSPKKKIKDLETGIIYDSCTDCAIAINHNITYISKHKDRFIKI